MANGYIGPTFGSTRPTREPKKKESDDSIWPTIGKIVGLGLVAMTGAGIAGLVPATVGGSAALGTALKTGTETAIGLGGQAGVEYATQDQAVDPRRISTFAPIQAPQPKPNPFGTPGSMQGGLYSSFMQGVAGQRQNGRV